MMFEQPSNAAPGLNDYLDAVSRRKALVLATTALLVAGTALFVSNRVDSFEAEARVLVGSSRALSNNEAVLQSPNLEREREVMLSDAVVGDAAEALGVEFDTANTFAEEVVVAFRPDSDVLTVTAVDDDANRAAEWVNAIAFAYTDRREAAETAFYETRISALEETVSNLEAESEANQIELDRLSAERATVLTSGFDAQLTSAQLSPIDSSITSLRASQNQIAVELRTPRSDLRDLVAQQATRSSSAEVLSPALVPTSPTGISDRILYAASVLVGLAAGVLLAFAMARLDRRVRSREDVEFTLNSPVLAGIPQFGWRAPEMVMLEEAPTGRNAKSAEAIRRLRSSVNFLIETHGHKTFVFTSAFPAEGKTTVCANLGVAFAKAGKRTAIVSADLRRPSLEARFGIQAERGLSDWLSGAEIDLLVETKVPELYLIPAGRRAANSAELLGLERFALLIEELTKNFDVALIDSPPVLSTADAVTVAGRADGCVVVIDGRRTEVDQISEVRSQLERSGASVAGAVVNREKARQGGWWSRDKYNYDSSAE